ncbi:MAG: RraA family protein [Nitrososphaerales archaeon]
MAEFKKYSVTVISDVMDKLGLHGILNGIHSINEGVKIVGKAVTVKGSAGVLGSYDLSEFKIGSIIDECKEGEVIVIDIDGACVSVWGGLASLAAKMKGIEGVVVNGGVRDIDEIKKLKFPVFTKHVTPRSGKTRVKIQSINEPIQINGVRIKKGDIIIGDDTGVISINSEKVQEVLNLSKELEEKERVFSELIGKGLSFRRIAEELKHM